jgi:PDZ domain-containing protein
MTGPSVTNDSPAPGDSEDETVGDTVDDVAAEATPTPGPRRRRRLWWWVGSLVVVGALLAGVLLIPLPYFLLQPGSLRPAEPKVQISGAPTFEHPGEVMFTTVYIDQATLGLLLRGAIDDAIEVRTEEEVYGREGRDGSKQANQQRMDLSKLVATKLALEYLGYPAALTGSGARVLGLPDPSPSAGLVGVGDVITAVDQVEVRLPDDIAGALAGRRPGDPVSVDLTTPTGERRSVTVVLGAAPDDPSRPVLGVNVDVADPRIDSPVQVSIDSGEVTGPSAGLAWALAVIDRMVEPSLTEGRDVAVTGEILTDGSVGAIGGITQKLAAVQRAGVEVFIYPAATPAEERAEIEAMAGDVQLVPVRTLDEAVEFLHPGGVRPPDA